MENNTENMQGIIQEEVKDDMKELEVKLDDICISRSDADIVINQIKQNIEADEGIRNAINLYVTQYTSLENRHEASKELLNIIQSVFNVFSDTLKSNCRVM